jgi:hypothetical protein
MARGFIDRPAATTATGATADAAATSTAASAATPPADLAPADRAGAIEVDPSLRMTAAAPVGEAAARVSIAPKPVTLRAGNDR